MPYWKAALATLGIIAAFSGVASAQVSAKAATSGGYPAYPGPGSSGYDYYNVVSGGFGNYGLPGSSPSFGGNALAGYGPGASLNGYFVAAQPSRTPAGRESPRTFNNLNGLAGTIRQQVGNAAKPGPGSSKGVSRPRKGR